ncbi:peptidase M24, structural domain-containing protein [Russula vinacea]|nr:peptidase M24, structural domain-containing protein [Russula vinacea]
MMTTMWMTVTRKGHRRWPPLMKPKKKKKVEQGDPPRTGLSKVYQDGKYPVGEIQEYRTSGNAWRTTSEEKRYLEKLAMEDPNLTYENIRRGAEVHRLVRKHARKGEWARGRNWLPTGLSRNNCAAHYTPNAGDTIVLKKEDVLKVDIGVHVRGRILDSAFTLTFEPTYDNLLEAVKAATNTGIQEAGIDARLGEIAGAIQETMESYEVEVGGKVYPVKAIENLSGHSIELYKIHGNKSVLLVKNDDQTKMEEGEYFAIETFGSTGRGRVVENGDVSHYAKRYDASQASMRSQTAKSLLRTITKNFGSLPFCRRYLDRVGESKYLYAEHTILLRPTVKEVVSRGEDY